MYQASDLFKKAISQKNRELRIRCTLDGIVYSDTDIQQCTIEESILTGEDFKFGSATASRFDLTLLNMDESLSAKSFEGKEVHIEIGVMLDKFHQPFEYVSMGKFIVEVPTKEKSLIKLTGHDKMIYFEKPYVSNITYPATLLQILQEVCLIANVPLKNQSFLNHDYVVGEKPNLENVTLRMAVEYISEVACGFATINRDTELEIATLSNTDTMINADNYYSMNLSEYEYGPIEQIEINPENIFADDQLKTNMLNAIKGFTFKPFTCSWQGNPLTAPGDVLNVSYKNGDTYKSFIANQKFTFSTGLKCDITTNAKTGIQSEYQSKGPLSQTIEKTKKEFASKIEQTESMITLEVERIDQSVSSLKIEADNITLSVQSLDGRVGTAESQLVIQAGQISSKVSSTDYNGNTIVSMINQTPESIKIQAKNIEMTGIVTFNDLETEGATIINGANIATQSMSADAIFGGWLRFSNFSSIFEQTDFGTTMVFSSANYKFEPNGIIDFGGNQVTGLNVVASFG
jgi:hypothetical protein